MADKTTTMDIEKKEQIMVKSRGTFDSREWRINDDEVKALPDNWRDMPSIIIGMKGNNPFLTIISDSQRKDLAEFIENYDPTDKSNAVTKFYNNTSVSKRKFIIRALAREKGRPLTEHDLKNIDWNKEKERIMTEALAGGYILVFQHDEYVECCTLEMTPKGIRAKDKFSFSDVMQK